MRYKERKKEKFRYGSRTGSNLKKLTLHYTQPLPTPPNQASFSLDYTIITKLSHKGKAKILCLERYLLIRNTYDKNLNLSLRV